MDLIEMYNEEMYVLVAPDGSQQAMTLSTDYATCISTIKMLHKSGIGLSYHELVKIKGFEILPVKVTMLQNGSAEEAFQKAKQKL